MPHLLQKKWPAVAAELQAAVQLAPFSNRVIRLCSEDEAQVAPLLETMAGEWGGEIAIGSYPVSRPHSTDTGGVTDWEVDDKRRGVATHTLHCPGPTRRHCLQAPQQQTHHSKRTAAA